MPISISFYGVNFNHSQIIQVSMIHFKDSICQSTLMTHLAIAHFNSVSMVLMWTLITPKSIYDHFRHKIGTGLDLPDHPLNCQFDTLQFHVYYICASTYFFCWPHLAFFLSSRLEPDPLSLDLYTVLKWFLPPHLSQVLPNAGQFCLPHLWLHPQ